MSNFDALLDKLSNTKSDGECYCPGHYEPVSKGLKTDWDYELAKKNLGIGTILDGDLIPGEDPPFFDRPGESMTFGFTDKRGIWLNKKGPFPLKTMAHEIAHNVLGHVKVSLDELDKTKGWLAAEEEHQRGETEAEVVSFLVMGELGFPELDIDEYIQWELYYFSNKMPLVFVDRERVKHAAGVILNAGRIPQAQEVAA